MSVDSSATKNRARTRRVTVLMLAAGAMTLVAVTDGLAQRGGGFARGGGGFGNGGRLSGGDGPRFPSGGPRFPGGGGVILVPGGYSGGTVVVEDGGPVPTPHRNRTVTKNSTPQKHLVQRANFSVPPAGERRFVTNEVLLNIPATTSMPALDQIARRHRLTRLDVQDFALTRHRLARVRINDGRPVGAVIQALRGDPRILGAQPNYLYALQGAADDSAAPQYSLAKLHLSQAHALATGERVLVAVVDTAIDANHPDLAGVVAASFDATGTPDMPRPHGTGIASVIAAHGKLTGAAPAVHILAAHAFGPSGADGSSLNILKGLEWAAKSKAGVVNMSFAGPADAELHTMLAALRVSGIALVAAVGNAGPKSPPLYPAADPNVIAVTATDADDKPFAQANRGTHIAVAAPGVNIIAAAPDGAYQMQSGTSFAAAQVSGIAALLIDRNPKLDAAAIRRILMTTAHDLGPPGHDDQFGAGLADALAAVTAASPQSNAASATPPTAN